MIKKVLQKILRKNKDKTIVSKNFSHQDSVKIATEKQSILKNIIHLNKLTVKDVMVPRSNIIWLDETQSLEKNLQSIKDFSHTRYPLCHKSLDNILGKIHIKEIILNVGRNVSLKKHMEPLLHVSPAMLCLDLLIKMKEEKSYMAIVVDEFGGVDGLATADNLVEKVVGEMEFSMQTPEAFYKVDTLSRTIIADGRCPLDLFEKHFGPFLTTSEQEKEIETLGGLIFLLIGRMPNRGEIIKHASDIVFEITEVHSRKIKEMRVYNAMKRTGKK